MLTSYQKIDDHHIEISILKNNLSDILKALLLNGIFVYEVRKKVLSLEDVFLKVVEESHDF